MDRIFEIVAPAAHTLPLVLASPHSGTDYAADFVAASPLDRHEIRRSEDSFVDELFAGAVAQGAPLLRALFPRAYVDANREPFELDPRMFADALPDYVNTSSARVRGGLGTVARLVADGAEIYGRKLSFAEVRDRIERFYMPYHAALRELVAQTRDRFGFVILIDCHSMPSVGGPMDKDPGHERVDFVLGDRYGSSCAPIVTETVEHVLRRQGYVVRRNQPYAGAFTTQNYGRPDDAMHALQIEVNRAIYMDERRYRRGAGIAATAQHLSAAVAALGRLDLRHWQPARLASE